MIFCLHAGHVEIHERGEKIFISSGVEMTIPASFLEEVGEEIMKLYIFNNISMIIFFVVPNLPRSQMNL